MTSLLSHTRLGVLLILLIGALASFALIVPVSAYTIVTVQTAHGMITGGAYPNLLILDVRTKAEYDSGHIYNATLIPVTDLQARIGELASHLKEPILVYCRSGGRSAEASGILDSNNFTQVYDMQGGITAWEAAGYPTWNATVHDVNSTFNYDTIQAAVDSSLTMNGDTISVDPGIYHEHVVVDKPLAIIGADPRSTMIDGQGAGIAISIEADNVIVENFTIRNSSESGMFIGGNNAQVQNNEITDNYCGLNTSSSNNEIFSNEIWGNQYCGVLITGGSSTIFENNITSNNIGICVNSSQTSMANLIYNNNLNNTYQALANEGAGLWDDGYPAGGNYWSNYNGTDLFSGVSQNVNGSDGVGDTPYTIDANNTDRYPLIRPWLWGPRNLTITSTDGGTTIPAPGTYEYNTTTYVYAYAIADQNYTFDHWELDGENTTQTTQTSIRTDADHTLKAVFARTKYALTITSTIGGTTDPGAGTYIFEPDTRVSVNAIPDSGYYLDGWELDNVYIGLFNTTSVVMDWNHTLQAVFDPMDSGHNIATKWVASKTVVFQGFNVSIQVTVLNTGSYGENFTVCAYVNSTSSMPQDVTLDSGAFTTLAFTLNTSGSPKGNYTVWAYSWPVPNETDTGDNNCTGGNLFVSMVGDLTGPIPFVPDGKCDGRDITAVAKCFGSQLGDPRYNPNCDILNRGRIDGRDITIVAKHFGQTSQ